MSALFALLLAQAATATPVASASPALPRAAVVVDGPDAAAVGTLAREVERRLQPRATIRSTAEVAQRIGVKTTVPKKTVDPAQQAEADKLLEEAVSAYYDAQSVQALDRLAKLQALHEQAGTFPLSKRAEALLWRIAVFLVLNDAEGARNEAMNALALDPDLKVDPKSDVPPSVQKALDEVRAAKHVKIVNVIVNGLPPVVELTCDGRNVGPRFKVTAGPHVLVAVAPGRRAVTRSFDVAADTSLTITLPVELRSDVTKTIADAIAKPERSNLAALAKELEVDWLVIVAPAGEATRALLVRGDIGVVAGFEDAAGADAGATLGDWAANELKEQLSGGKPRVVRPVGQGTDVRAQLALATRIRKLSGGGGDYSAFFAGAGARVLAENARGARVFAGELEILDYSLTTLEVSLPDGSKRSAGGGRTLALAGGAAWQRPLGDGTFAVRGGGGLAAELHLATDVTYPSGQKSGLLTGYTRIAPELTGGARMRTGGARTIAISADLGVSPISLWIESTGANGSSPKPGLALTWRLGGGVERPTSPWAWHVEYRGSQRSVSFSGRADAPSSPPIDDATLAESFHSLGFTASRRF